MRRIIAIVVLVGTIVAGGAVRGDAVVRSWNGRATGPGALVADGWCALQQRYVVSGIRFTRPAAPDAALSISACMTSSSGGYEYWAGTFTIVTARGARRIDGTASLSHARAWGGFLTVTGGTDEYACATGRMVVSGGIVNGLADLTITGSVDATPRGGTLRRWTGHVSGGGPFQIGGGCPFARQQVVAAAFTRPGRPVASLSADGCIAGSSPLGWGGTFTITTARGATIAGTFFGALSGGGAVMPYVGEFTVTGGTGEYAHAAGALHASGVLALDSAHTTTTVNLDMSGSISF